MKHISSKPHKKLSSSTGVLSKVRHYVPKHLLRTIYYSIFNVHLIYACEVWEQKQNNLILNKLTKLQNKALRLMNFQPLKTPTGLLYHANKISKIGDFTKYENALFVQNKLRKGNPPLFNEMFNMLNQNHTYNSRAATDSYTFLLHISYTFLKFGHRILVKFPLDLKHQKHGMIFKEI